MITLRIHVGNSAWRVFEYDVPNNNTAKKRAKQITKNGWHRIKNGDAEYYPAHEILKVTFNSDTIKDSEGPI